MMGADESTEAGSSVAPLGTADTAVAPWAALFCQKRTCILSPDAQAEGPTTPVT